jgi:hypothetical protein
MMVPTLKGSVFEALILTSMMFGDLMYVSERYRVTLGSWDLTWDDVYSDTLKNPKNAVSMAAQSITLSS